jgi:hypothetical protein
MINTEYCTSFRWETRSGYICRNNSLQVPIGSSVHFVMGLTLSPRLWVTIILISTLPLSLACTHCLMWTSFDHIFHLYWTPQRSKQLKPTELNHDFMEHEYTDQIIDTQVKGTLHSRGSNFIGLSRQGNSCTKEVAHPKPNST